MRRMNQTVIAFAILIITIGAIAGALVFEALGYAPCELCLKERIRYYGAIPIAGYFPIF